jgi:protein-tyrosine-phosphatase
VFRAKAKAAGISEQLVIDSAGTHAYHIGEPPDARSHGFAVKRGFDLSQQRARQIKAEDLLTSICCWRWIKVISPYFRLRVLNPISISWIC